jgi:hypothetical protein
MPYRQKAPEEVGATNNTEKFQPGHPAFESTYCRVKHRHRDKALVNSFQDLLDRRAASVCMLQSKSRSSGRCNFQIIWLN